MVEKRKNIAAVDVDFEPEKPASDDQMDLIKSISSEFSELEGCCFYAHVASELRNIMTGNDVKVNRAISVLVIKGHIKIEFNTHEVDIVAPAMLSLKHDSVVRVLPTQEDKGVDCYMIGYETPFLRDINISFSVITGEAMIEHDDPVLRLNDREMSQMLRYYSLIFSVLNDNFNHQLNRHIVSSLTTAIFYQVTLFLYKRLEMNHIDNASSRRTSYVEDFLRLVHINYMRERSVSFYANKLFISPKYLSLLVKEVTGRTAARWIDFFVIMEAKNLLRYSGKNVQQVAYALNFTNQSSFGKYFKHLTGMSPTDYQKS